MILQSLCNYYDTVVSDESFDDMPRMGYSNAKVSYVLEISQEGELENIISVRVPAEKGNKLFPETITVPEQVKRAAGVDANFLCDNSKYVFGISKDKNKPIQISNKHFEAFKQLHINILENLEDKGAKAILNFLKTWNIEQAEEKLKEKYLDNNIEDLLQGANFIFQLKDEFEYIHNKENIREAWQEYKSQSKEGQIGQCLITGEETEVALLHGNIKNIRGAQPAGAAIVSFNIPSFISYGKKQSYNAPVGTKSAFKYTTMLNYMLQNSSKQKVQIGDATTVFWAEYPNPDYVDLPKYALDPSIKSDDKKTEAEKLWDDPTEEKLQKCFNALRKGEKLKDTDLEVEDDAEFYILGLSPNNARVSVRFFHRCTFGNFMENLAQHHEDIELVYKPEFFERNKYIPLWMIIDEIIPKNSKNKKYNSMLNGKIMHSIITGNKYPDNFLTSILLRFKADQEVNYTRIAIIKAYLIRKARLEKNKELKETLEMPLDEKTENKAYRLGRLFCYLERIQKLAQGKDINATIKDKYMSTAATSPERIFPFLLDLAEKHLRKSKRKDTEKAFAYGYDRKLNEILEPFKINKDAENKESVFPKNLTLAERGLFFVGYRQQSFHKKEENEKE